MGEGTVFTGVCLFTVERGDRGDGLSPPPSQVRMEGCASSQGQGPPIRDGVPPGQVRMGNVPPARDVVPTPPPPSQRWGTYVHAGGLSWF